MNTSTEKPLTFLDPEVQVCPFSAYEKLRAETPVYRDPVTKHFILTRYADIRNVLLKPQIYSNRCGMTVKRESMPKEAEEILRTQGWEIIDTLVSEDPPDHRVHRSLLDKELTPAFVRSREQYLQSLVAELLSPLIGLAETEFVDSFALPLPLRVSAELLGFPREDVDKLYDWTMCSKERSSPGLSPAREVALAHSLVEMQQYFAKSIQRARRHPDGSVLSHLIQARVEDRELTMVELLSILQVLLPAAHETTAGALASGVKLLIDNPAEIDKLRANPRLIPTFVDETLRLMTPLQTLFRRAQQDVEIDGVRIPKGSIVEVRYGAANRDEKMFADPGRFDSSRENANLHLGFGAGIHTCPGNQLARLELRITFQYLVDHVAIIRATRGEASFIYDPNYLTFGLGKLYCALQPRP